MCFHLQPGTVFRLWKAKDFISAMKWKLTTAARAPVIIHSSHLYSSSSHSPFFPFFCNLVWKVGARLKGWDVSLRMTDMLGGKWLARRAQSAAWLSVCAHARSILFISAGTNYRLDYGRKIKLAVKCSFMMQRVVGIWVWYHLLIKIADDRQSFTPTVGGRWGWTGKRPGEGEVVRWVGSDEFLCLKLETLPACLPV